ncbi:MAG: hypothetical protein ACTH8A_13765, partial [Serratia proteamaculans]
THGQSQAHHQSDQLLNFHLNFPFMVMRRRRIGSNHTLIYVHPFTFGHRLHLPPEQGKNATFWAKLLH